MLRYLLSATTGIALTLGAAHAADSWRVDHDASTLGFIGTQGSNEFTGSFGSWSADISFSPDDLANSRVEVTIDMGTAEAGSDQRTNALPGAEWFNVSAFPTGSFVAESFTHEGGDSYSADGTLQIRSISQEVSLPFTLTIDGDTARVVGSLDILRNTYDVGTGSFANEDSVKFAVEITVDLTATRN